MINPLSLSPGNFLLDPRTNEWIEIDNVYANGYVNVEDGEGIKIEDLEPIILTPETLKRCGFDFEDVADNGQVMLRCGTNLCLAWNDKDKTLFIDNHNTGVLHKTI